MNYMCFKYRYIYMRVCVCTYYTHSTYCISYDAEQGALFGIFCAAVVDFINHTNFS